MTSVQTTEAKVCEYCKNLCDLVDGLSIYPHREDLKDLRFWECSPCNAYVGCHKKNKKYSPNGSTPLGRLANPALRAAKSQAHRVFDPIWKEGSFSRSGAYAWLSKKLDLSKDETHIGLFDVDMCLKVVEAIRGVEND